MLLATILTYPMSCKVLQSFSTYSYKFKETFSVLCVQSICVLGHPISFYVFVFECFVLISLYVYFSLFDCRCAKMIWLYVFILCLSLSYSFFDSLSLFNFFLPLSLLSFLDTMRNDFAVNELRCFFSFPPQLDYKSMWESAFANMLAGCSVTKLGN